MLRRVALVRTDVSVERIASIIRVTKIGELGTTLAVTSNRSTLRRNTMFTLNQLVKEFSYIYEETVLTYTQLPMKRVLTQTVNYSYSLSLMLFWSFECEVLC
jgi:hypothetical protein